MNAFPMFIRHIRFKLHRQLMDFKLQNWWFLGSNDENHKWLSHGIWVVSCFELNKHDPINIDHMEERENPNTAHFS